MENLGPVFGTILKHLDASRVKTLEGKYLVACTSVRRFHVEAVAITGSRVPCTDRQWSIAQDQRLPFSFQARPRALQLIETLYASRMPRQKESKVCYGYIGITTVFLCRPVPSHSTQIEAPVGRSG